MSLNQTNIESNVENDEGDDDDEELVALKERKNQLLTEVCELREKLIAEERRHEIEMTANFIGLQMENGDIKTNSSKRKEIEFSERLLGVSFNDISKTLLQDDVYHYKVILTTEALRIAVELTVRTKNKESNEIINMDCYFPDTELDTCYRKEVESWINISIETKDFSSLLSAFVHYVNQSFIRKRMLRQLEKRKYVTIKHSTNEEGGLTVNVHSPKNADNIYFTLIWATRFLKKNCQIHHFFIIESTDEESSFVKKYSQVIKQFGRTTLEKIDIDEIWADVINAIESEEEIFE